MRFSNLLIWFALAAGVALPGASTLKAQEYDGREAYQERRDLRHDYRNADRLRADVARDQARYDEAIRCGRRGEAERIGRDMARDRQALDWQLRDIHHDRRDAYRDGWR